MSIRELLTYKFVLPAYGLAKGLRLKKDYKILSRVATWDREAVIRLQRQKLEKLISHAYETVQFYRERFDELGLTPRDIKGIEDLKKLPPLRRKDIQKYYSEIISKEADITKCYKGSSSGSTGHPVLYVRDRRGSSLGKAANYFGWSLAGWNFGKRYLTIWGNPTCVHVDWQKASSKLKSFAFNEVKAAAFELTRERRFDDVIRLLRGRVFEFIQGYTSAIFVLARYLMENGIEVRPVKGVFTTAENLFSHQRKTIQEVFGPVFDFYGCGEINSVAFQCQVRNGYHVIDPHVIIEYGDTVDVIGNRELIITDLDNYAMPLIRYANGDMGIPGNNESCPCGLPFSRLERVSGRVSDIIETPGGGAFTVPSFFGSRLLRDVKGLVRYQVELVEPLKIRVNLQVDSSFNTRQESMLKEGLREYIPKSFKWEVRYCDEIKADSNGKFKIFIDRTKAISPLI